MDDREPFQVTDDEVDAPDGSAIQEEDGWWQRHGEWWYPITAEEASKELDNLPPV